jgi:hypothetical protein
VCVSGTARPDFMRARFQRVVIGDEVARNQAPMVFMNRKSEKSEEVRNGTKGKRF